MIYLKLYYKALVIKTFLATSGYAQGLFITLLSEITPGHAWVTIYDAGYCTEVGCLQAKCLTHCTNSLAQCYCFFPLCY